MDSDTLLNAVAVKGEISNYKLYPSGHHYFTLKDEGGALRCVMFKGNASRKTIPYAIPMNGFAKITNAKYKAVIIKVFNSLCTPLMKPIKKPITPTAPSTIKMSERQASALIMATRSS